MLLLGNLPTSRIIKFTCKSQGTLLVGKFSHHQENRAQLKVFWCSKTKCLWLKSMSEASLFILLLPCNDFYAQLLISFHHTHISSLQNPSFQCFTIYGTQSIAGNNFSSQNFEKNWESNFCLVSQYYGEVQDGQWKKGKLYMCNAFTFSVFRWPNFVALYHWLNCCFIYTHTI